MINYKIDLCSCNTLTGVFVSYTLLRTDEVGAGPGRHCNDRALDRNVYKVRGLQERFH